MDSELVKVYSKFPLDLIVEYKGKPIGRVIGYKRANGTGSIEVIFQHFPEYSNGDQRMFSIRSPHYKLGKQLVRDEKK